MRQALQTLKALVLAGSLGLTAATAFAHTAAAQDRNWQADDGRPTDIRPGATRHGAPGNATPTYERERPAPRADDDSDDAPPPRDTYVPRDRYVPPDRDDDGTFSPREINTAGHRFFGRVSEGLAHIIEYSFSRAGRPNGYILGEEAGGAFIAGLRYGEGVLYTKNAGRHKVYWQGPSIGYDFGAEGSKTMILVYNLNNVRQVYERFGGIDGSAYFVGGVGITFQTHDDVVMAPIRAGVGLRLGANVGYLKYTRAPTWNPF